jgi:ABC-type transporter Mla MlaB component
MEFQRSLKKQGIVVDKAQKGELRIAEDNIEELKRRIELQVLFEIPNQNSKSKQSIRLTSIPYRLYTVLKLSR